MSRKQTPGRHDAVKSPSLVFASIAALVFAASVLVPVPAGAVAVDPPPTTTAATTTSAPTTSTTVPPTTTTSAAPTTTIATTTTTSPPTTTSAAPTTTAATTSTVAPPATSTTVAGTEPTDAGPGDNDQAGLAEDLYLLDPCRLGCDLGTGINYNQWHLAELGLQAPPALSAEGLVVAVVDGGVQLDHPDLVGLVSRAQCGPTAGAELDLEHGTNIAGLITAIDGDGVGLGAPASGIRVLDIPVIAIDDAGNRNASVAALAQGIDCAVDEGADVINLSMAGSCSGTEAVAEALARAESAGVIVVAAAGNVDLANAPCPAAYPSVISVAAAAETGFVVAGARWGDVTAPGFELVTASASTQRPRTLVSGTSMAAPLVAVGLAVLRSEHPSWTPEQIRVRVRAAVAQLDRFTIPGILQDDLFAGVGVTSDGRVLAIGDTSVSARAPTGSAVDVAVLDCGGVVVAAADGGVFALDGAPFWGSLGGLDLAAPVVAMAATPTGRGYWMAAADGGVFAFGDAGYHGSLGGLAVSSRIVDFATTSNGRGYWMLAADGQVYAFGNANHSGAVLDPASSMVAIFATADGYAVTRSDGRTVGFGSTTKIWSPPPLDSDVVNAFDSPAGPILVTQAGELTSAADGRRVSTSPGVVAASSTNSQSKCSEATGNGADQ